ncbi:protein OS-9-like [Saccostrea echinata]|uniref:protein OS-9-like n=1 Tax=Saccostrea echinata TaxID=191078 RepID=UPI002A81E508|nr:protein OS-9-like [Saccostrea echinata]
MKMESKQARLVTFSLLLFCTTVASFLDMEELKNINYGIDILNKPVLLSTQETDKLSETIDVTSKHGQIYRCTIPSQMEAEKQKEEEEKIAMETGVPELLKAMESGPCLFKTRDWWSYEFCYGKHVRQFHMEDGRIEGNVIMLGYYESEFDWRNETNMEVKSRNKNRLNRYHSQQYINGSKCDLTGKARKTEVRFLCEEGRGDYIARLDEPETCSYVMTIHTTKICHHPYLKLPTHQKPVPITCNPAVSDEIYQDYLKEEEEKRIMKEKLEEEQRIEKELRDADALFNSDEKMMDSKVQKELPLPNSIKKTDNSRTFEFKDVSDLGHDMSKIEKLISAGLKDDIVKLSDQFGGQDVDMKMKVKVVRSMDDLEDMLKEAQSEVESLVKKKKKEEDEEESTPEEANKQKDTTLKFEKKSITEKIQDTVSDIDKELDGVDEKVLQSFKEIQDDDINSVREKFTKNRNNLASIKESLRKTMESEFDEIIEEAEEETGIKLEDRKGAQKELSKTLNKLIERLDKTEKDILNVDKELERLSKNNAKLQQKLDKELDEIAKGPSKTEELPSDDQSSSKSSSSSLSSSPSSSLSQSSSTSSSSSSKDRVKIRVTKLTKGEFQKSAMKSTPQTQKLEEDVQDQLQKAGLDLGNGKIQVKIITAGYVDDKDDVHLLSAEDTSAFKNMIVSILGGDHEAAEEEVRHSNMESNYNKVWGKSRKKSSDVVP